jgi:ADP-ribosyl-[dinitrogen reductase] hydrolase
LGNGNNQKIMVQLKNIESCFLGLAVGDALGVPVEFSSRGSLKLNPVTTMMGHGCWNQPRGTWSDDSSLAFCLAEGLAVDGYNLDRIGERFVKWMKNGYWGAHHKVFDVGGTTRMALQRISDGENPLHSGEFDEDSNGNGSLMRITPASIYFSKESDDELMERMREVSGITHRHFRSVFSCFVFSKFISSLLQGIEKREAYLQSMEEINRYIQTKDFNPDEIKLFKRLLSGGLTDEGEDRIRSSGYVLHTLEASIWCFLHTNDYREAVLKAVNLGEDTDTTGCVTGAIAGLYYGKESIPQDWIEALARKEDIIQLSKDFQKSMDRLIFAGN